MKKVWAVEIIFLLILLTLDDLNIQVELSNKQIFKYGIPGSVKDRDSPHLSFFLFFESFYINLRKFLN